jgi:rare lipoprotein A
MAAKAGYFLFMVMFTALVVVSCASVPTERPAVPPRSTVEGKGTPYEVFGKKYYPLLSPRGFEEIGIASWYGGEFHGRKTSNGEIYNMHCSTAAHKTLPFDTVVRITNLETGQDTLARINDRGPFVKERIVDLSLKCAADLGILNKGTAAVKVVAIGRERRMVIDGREQIFYEPPSSYEIGNFTIQVGSFVVWQNAERLKRSLAEKYENAHIAVYDRGDQKFYRVRVERAPTLRAAISIQNTLENKGFQNTFVVAE